MFTGGSLLVVHTRCGSALCSDPRGVSDGVLAVRRQWLKTAPTQPVPPGWSFTRRESVTRMRNRYAGSQCWRTRFGDTWACSTDSVGQAVRSIPRKRGRRREHTLPAGLFEVHARRSCSLCLGSNAECRGGDSTVAPIRRDTDDSRTRAHSHILPERNITQHGVERVAHHTCSRRVSSVTR
jgi:hypothetical protein